MFNVLPEEQRCLSSRFKCSIIGELFMSAKMQVNKIDKRYKYQKKLKFSLFEGDLIVYINNQK